MPPSFDPIASTPLSAWHQRHGARMARYRGWQQPLVYSQVAAETQAARTGLALADISAFGKVCVHGKESAGLSASGLSVQPGKVFQLSAPPWNWVCYLREDHWLLLADEFDNPAEPLTLPSKLLGCCADREWRETFGYACFVLFGPDWTSVLARLTSLDVRTVLEPGCCAETGLAGVPAILARIPLTPSTVRILVSWDLAEFVWEVLWQTGRVYGMVPLGIEALRELWELPGLAG
jgi:glycine cleavage system aminomethyltransferase T